MGNSLSEQIQKSCIIYGVEEIIIKKRIEFLKSKGGFGVILSAFSEKLQMDVAIKCIQVEKSQNVERIKQECELQQKFQNKINFLQIYETLHQEQNLSILYIVTELCETKFFFPFNKTRNLRKLIDEGEYNEQIVLSISLQLLAALEEMQNQNIVHFDIKPENIFYIQNNKRYIVKMGRVIFCFNTQTKYKQI